MKKELPKYFVIKQDSENPLWTKYIKWLNERYNVNFDWTCGYYWYDWSKDYNWANHHWNISSFQNNPTEITLEEWNEIVNNLSWEETNNDKEIFTPWEQVGVSSVSIEKALEDLKTDTYEYYYIWITKEWVYVVEDNNWKLENWPYICKMPIEE